MIGVIGVIISLILLILLAYKGWSVILIAPILALIASVFVIFEGGDFHMMAIYTGTYMPNLAAYVKANFPIFLLGAVFGKVMDLSGSAKSIAETIVAKAGRGKELWAVVISWRGHHLRRRFPFRSGFRHLSDRCGAVQRNRYPEETASAGYRARCIYLHHDCDSGHTADSEHDSDGILRYRYLCGADPRALLQH